MCSSCSGISPVDILSLTQGARPAYSEVDNEHGAEHLGRENSSEPSVHFDQEPGNVTCLLFVYGSFLQGGGHHSYMENAKYLGKYRSFVPFPLGTSTSPCILNLPGRGRNVFGELYAISKDTLASLDHLENTSEVSRRIALAVASTENHSAASPAYAYVRNNFGSSPPGTVMMADYQCRKFAPQS